MGLKKIYLDTCVIIYLVEKRSEFSTVVESLVNSLEAVEFCYSHLCILEAYVLPLRRDHSETINSFEKFFDSETCLEITQKVFESAAKLRADFPSLKTPDALHLATAIHHKCDEFWTNDDRLHKVAPSIVQNIINN